MKYTKTIVAFCMASLLLCIIGGYIYVANDATKQAIKLSEILKNYEMNEKEDLTTGVELNLYKNNIKGIDLKNASGIIHIDEDNEIDIIYNVEINGLACKNILDNPKCSIFYKKDSTIYEPEKYKEYAVGDIVTLDDDTKWYVIHDSNYQSKYVMLINEERIDINKDGTTIEVGELVDPDRIPFDTSGSKKYDENSNTNIGYYLENEYRNSLPYKNILDIRLLTIDELEAIKERIEFRPLTDDQKRGMAETSRSVLNVIGFYSESPRPVERLKNVVITEQQRKALMPHWLFNEFSGNFWVMNDNKATTATWDGDGYTSKKATTGSSLKPVIVISKENIKES